MSQGPFTVMIEGQAFGPANSAQEGIQKGRQILANNFNLKKQGGCTKISVLDSDGVERDSTFV